MRNIVVKRSSRRRANGTTFRRRSGCRGIFTRLPNVPDTLPHQQNRFAARAGSRDDDMMSVLSRDSWLDTGVNDRPVRLNDSTRSEFARI
jgi:hypothetical protein